MNRFVALIVFSFSVLALSGCSTKDEYTVDALENYNALWRTLDRGYSFFDLKLPKDSTWRDMYNKYRPEIRAGMSSDSLFLVMNKLLHELKDGHVNLITPFDNGHYWGWQDNYPANYHEDLVKLYLGKEVRYAGSLRYTQIKHNNHSADSIGYLRFPSFAGALSASNLNAALSRLSHCRALIIDIRGNGGGNLTTSDLFASHFVSQERLIGSTRHKTGPGHNDFSEPIKLYLRPVSVGIRWLRPVVLLTNRGVYSAANDFVLKMKGLPFVTVMGDRTGGGGGMPMSSELPNGWAIRYSSTQTFDTEGNHIELGIEPDYYVELERAHMALGTDTLIEVAIQYLKERFSEARQTKKWRK